MDLVRELAGTCNAVPRKEDVNLLWSATGTRYDEGLKKLVLDLYGGMKTTNMLCEDGEDEGVFWDELFLIGLVERMRVAYEQEKGRKEGGGDGKGFGKGNEYVKMGRLVGRRRCDYHDHEW